MARPKKNVTVSKETLLSQPMALSLLPYNYNASKNQLKLINAIVRKLQTLIKTSIAQKRKTGLPVDMRTFFDTAYNSRVLREEVLHKDDYVFDLHLSEFGVEPKRYPELYNELFKLGSIQAMMSFETEHGDRGITPVPLFQPIFWETRGEKIETTDKDGKKVTIYKYNKKKPEITIAIRKDMAEQVFNLNGWIDHYLDYVVTNCDSGYTGRIYIYLSSVKTKARDNVWTENYQNFRDIMGFIGTEKDKYPYYSDFRKRVLESSRKELQRKAEAGECDLWFEYEPFYSETGGRTPQSIAFTIHLSDLGRDNEAAKQLRHKQAVVEEYLRNTLDQSPTQAGNLTMAKKPDALTVEELDRLLARARQLQEYIVKHKPTFRTTKRAYCNKTLSDFVRDELLPLREAKVMINGEWQPAQQQPTVWGPTEKPSENVESTKSEENKVDVGLVKMVGIQALNLKNAIDRLKCEVSEQDFRYWVQPALYNEGLDGTTLVVFYRGNYYTGKYARQNAGFMRLLGELRKTFEECITDIRAIHVMDTAKGRLEQTL